MLYQQLKDANIAALKNKDANARAILSVLLNKIKLSEIERRAAGAELTDADIVKVLQKTLKELEEEKQAFVNANRTDSVSKLDEQIAFVSKYLPKMMSEEQIKAEIMALPDKSIPVVMAYFKKEHNGECDMRLVQSVLKSIVG